MNITVERKKYLMAKIINKAWTKLEKVVYYIYV